MMKHLPTWKAIKAYVDGTPMVPEHCIVRDGYYLDMFDLDKLPKEDEGVQQNVMPELTWSRDDDYALGAVAMQINEARRKAVEGGQDALAEHGDAPIGRVVRPMFSNEPHIIADFIQPIYCDFSHVTTDMNGVKIKTYEPTIEE